MKFLKMLEATPDPGHIHLYWLGQAGFLIKNSLGKVMLIDAYLSGVTIADRVAGSIPAVRLQWLP